MNIFNKLLFNLCNISPSANKPSNSSSNSLGLLIILLCTALVVATVAIILLLVRNSEIKKRNNYSIDAIEKQTQPFDDDTYEDKKSEEEVSQIHFDRETSRNSMQEESAPQQQPAPQQVPVAQAVPQNKHGFLKFLIVILIIGIFIFSIVKFVDCLNNPHNSDGGTKLLSRSASNSDIKLEQSVEATIMNLKDSYIVIPNCDIQNLQITFTYYNSSGNALSSVTKDIGSVVENSSYTITIDHTISEIISIEKYSYSVTGGTVSYFG
ncbi:MAG: hypothetical protein K2L12_03920 [Clostridia bacterium]|nr:hypothetical protein [Clostridia bacterium]